MRKSLVILALSAILLAGCGGVEPQRQQEKVSPADTTGSSQKIDSTSSKKDSTVAGGGIVIGIGEWREDDEDYGGEME